MPRCRFIFSGKNDELTPDLLRDTGFASSSSYSKLWVALNADRGVIQCQFIFPRNPVSRVIRCRFIFSGKNDELTPDLLHLFGQE